MGRVDVERITGATRQTPRGSAGCAFRAGGVRLPLIPCFSSFALRSLGVAIDLAKSDRPAADYSINRNESMGTYRSNIMTLGIRRDQPPRAMIPPVADIINGYYNA